MSDWWRDWLAAAGGSCVACVLLPMLFAGYVWLSTRLARKRKR